MSLQHTPGPWSVGKGGWEPWFGAVPIDAGLTNTVAYVTTGSDGEQQAADARLIAAAPDMLAALKAAFVEIRNPGTTARNGQDIAAVVLAAITKAEGRD